MARNPVRPEHMKIGAFDITIEYDESLAELQAAGVSSRAQSLVIVDPEYAPQQLRDTIVHEALHLMWKQTSLLVRYPDDGPDSPGELVIQDLTPLVYSFIRDNPEVVRWLQKS